MVNVQSFLGRVVIVSLAASTLSAAEPRQPAVDPTIPVIAPGSAFRIGRALRRSWIRCW